jgi:hypothetical protein
MCTNPGVVRLRDGGSEHAAPAEFVVRQVFKEITDSRSSQEFDNLALAIVHAGAFFGTVVEYEFLKV